MGALNDKNKEVFDTISDCLYQHTINGAIKWVENKGHLFNSDTEKHFNSFINDQKFEVVIKINNGKFSSSALIVWDESLSDEFSLNNGSVSINKLGNLIFDVYLKDNLTSDKESEVLNGILSKIGKNIIREKRLSQLLDGEKGDKESKSDKKTFFGKIFTKKSS